MLREVTPLESLEQTWLFQWVATQEGKYPELELLHHIPNGGKRDKKTAEKLKAEGVKAGVPDICLPVARKGYNNLYIELKRIGGKVSKEQEAWIDKLNRAGNKAVIKEGWIEAAKEIINYLEMDVQL